MDILNKSKQLKADADELIRNLGLMDIAKKYGEVHQIGSSVMDLMVDGDIDIIFYEKDAVDISKCMEFAKELIAIPGVEIIKLKNYLHRPEYKQFKVYIDPYRFKNTDWQIAFSFHVKTDKLVDVELNKIKWVLDKLTPESKLIILQLKQSARNHNRKIPGAIIYDMVLKYNVRTYDELINKIESA